ncbi:MAG: GAF domain-containing protein [Parasphingorhabdus sp.]|uniref:GAF domain-containing protein n=1 Tax=Parasphingorhabdus sp. TaxID=2709688 RepID=UPI0030011645
MNLMTKLNDEQGRLAALHRYNILDTGHEERFDRITKVVEMALRCPITAISLVDADRQWFKSRQGLDVDETARDISFCTHTIKNAKPMIVEDAWLDSRFSKNPLVTGNPNIRSYIGVPLLTPGGFNIGSLCAIDTTPREFDDESIELLSQLAQLVIHELELRKNAPS